MMGGLYGPVPDIPCTAADASFGREAVLRCVPSEGLHRGTKSAFFAAAPMAAFVCGQKVLRLPIDLCKKPMALHRNVDWRWQSL
jgi:hypothetical protein